MPRSLADGGMRANRNCFAGAAPAFCSLADGGMRANRNMRWSTPLTVMEFSRWGNAGQAQLNPTPRAAQKSLADGGMRANRNVLAPPTLVSTSLADGGMRANRNNRTFRMPRDRV